MADDDYRKPFRADDSFGRTTGAGGGPSATDPLAELARLIGQTDPFGEFGHSSRATPSGSHPQQSPPLAAYPSQSRAGRDDLMNPAVAGNPPQYGLPLGAQPRMPDDYVGSSAEPDYEPAAYGASNGPGYDPDAFTPGRRLAGEDASYDDIPPPRRRLGVMVIAGVFALVVVGTAGALGFRTLFGPSGVSPPPVVRAETTPSKVVPASSAAQTEKLINERIGDRSRDEKLVSREERPLDLAARSDAPPTGARATGGGSAAGPPVAGSGPTRLEDLYEPKKVKTVAIRPDQPAAADTAAPARPAAATPVASAPAQRQAARAPAEPLSISSLVERDGNRPPAASAAERTGAANGPLSLAPGAAPSPQPPAQAPRIAAAPAGGSIGTGYAVQVSSQRSEADAQASFRSMQSQFPSQLGGRQPIIRRADLGSKGVFYRAMVGPFPSPGEAAQLCDGIKAAGGQCLIQRF